jgi:hypothetical protein
VLRGFVGGIAALRGYEFDDFLDVSHVDMQILNIDEFPEECRAKVTMGKLSDRRPFCRKHLRQSAVLSSRRLLLDVEGNCLGHDVGTRAGADSR